MLPKLKNLNFGQHVAATKKPMNFMPHTRATCVAGFICGSVFDKSSLGKPNLILARLVSETAILAHKATVIG